MRDAATIELAFLARTLEHRGKPRNLDRADMVHIRPIKFTGTRS